VAISVAAGTAKTAVVGVSWSKTGLGIGRLGVEFLKLADQQSVGTAKASTLEWASLEPGTVVWTSGKT
jgi:hypothetical protein